MGSPAVSVHRFRDRVFVSALASPDLCEFVEVPPVVACPAEDGPKVGELILAGLQQYRGQVDDPGDPTQPPPVLAVAGASSWEEFRREARSCVLMRGLGVYAAWGLHGPRGSLPDGSGVAALGSLVVGLLREAPSEEGGAAGSGRVADGPPV